MITDVAIAGGGPVGLVAALYARRAGLEVVVIEPRTGVIDKACGEGVMPEAVERLRDLGVDPNGREFFGIRYISGKHRAEARFTAGPGRGIRRVELHQALLDRAREVGVTFVRDRVTDVTQRREGVEVAGVRARYLVGADGLHSSVRSIADLNVAARGVQRFGVRQHFRIKPWTDLVEVHWLRDAEVYITPVSDDCVGFAVLGRRPVSLDDSLARLPEVCGRLRGAESASSERGAGPLRQSTSARTAGRVLLVGDAAGYVDALTGEGLRMGFAEAQAVIDAVARDDPTSYEKEWERLTRSYRRLTDALLWIGSRPTLRRMIVPTAHAFPGLFRRGVDSL